MRRRADLALLAVAALATGGCGGGGGAAPRPARPAAPPAPGPAPLTIGVTTHRLAVNSWDRWGRGGLRSVSAFERAVRTRAGLVMWYSDWARVDRPRMRQLRLVAAHGAVPEITWEPWNAGLPIHRRQPRFAPAAIAAGRRDAYVRRWARALAAYGGPVRLRFAHEMNGDWYPWSDGVRGNRPGDYVRAWRHVHRIFREEGADNVLWVWSPVTGRPLRGWPGRAYVDILGVSGFVGGPHLRRAGWKSFGRAFGRTLDALERLAPGLPIEISEVGVTERGGDKAEWIRRMFAALAARPRVVSVTWFNLRQQADWRAGTSRASRHAFARAARDARRVRSAAR